MRKLRNVIIFVIVITATFWLLQKIHVLPSLKNLFAAKPVLIDETPVLIKDIKSIGQLITFSFYDEVVADSVITTPGSNFVNAFNHLAPVPILPSADRQLVLIGKGKILAGTDLTLLTDTSIISKNDTITVILPKPKILASILNPGDFETFIEKGNWTNEEVTQVKLRARKKMEEHASQQNLPEKAGAKAKTILENFFRDLGYKEIVILQQ